MLRRSLDRCRIPSLLLAVLLALFGAASAQSPFVAMEAKGEVSVYDARTKLSFDLKSNFSLGANSNGINPLAESLQLDHEYAGAVPPCLIVSVAAGCFTQTGNGYKVGMQDIHNCGVSIRLLNVPQSPNEILPFVELLPAVDKFDLRLTPGPDGKWDLKLNIDFLTSNPNVPFAAIIAVLRSPTTVKIETGDDFGHATVDRVAFEGRVAK